MKVILLIVVTLLSLCFSQDKCADGTAPYNCFQSPCANSKCEVAGAKCVDDYCGGCFAHWVDEKGNTVCDAPDVDCRTVLCADVLCADDEEKVYPDGKCCPTCQKKTLDCSAVKCEAPVCEGSETLITPEGSCCQKCYQKPVDCSNVDCVSQKCAEDEVEVTADGQCCSTCQKKAVDCRTVKCPAPNCGKDQIAYQPEGKCCMACKDGCDKVECFADPCSVSKCDVDGAICTSDYCGGCNAIWTLKDGTPVTCEKRVGDSDERTKVFASADGAEKIEDVIDKLQNYLTERGISFDSIEKSEVDGKPVVVVVFKTSDDADIASRAVTDNSTDFIVVEQQENSSVTFAAVALLMVASFF